MIFEKRAQKKKINWLVSNYELITIPTPRGMSECPFSFYLYIKQKEKTRIEKNKILNVRVFSIFAQLKLRACCG